MNLFYSAILPKKLKYLFDYQSESRSAHEKVFGSQIWENSGRALAGFDQPSVGGQSRRCFFLQNRIAKTPGVKSVIFISNFKTRT